MDTYNVTSNITAMVDEFINNPHKSSSAAMYDKASSLSNCFNSTLFEALVRGILHNATTMSKEQRREIEGDPLVYIIAVLIFYSCGIVVLMINYMKKVRFFLSKEIFSVRNKSERMPFLERLCFNN